MKVDSRSCQEKFVQLQLSGLVRKGDLLWEMSREEGSLKNKLGEAGRVRLKVNYENKQMC